MEIRNISEDIVFSSVQKIIESIKQENNPDRLCLCEQCRLDTICFVLNRVEPRYIVSNRGITRIEQDWGRRQQIEADIATLVYRGLRQVNHNQRSTADHSDVTSGDKISNEPEFFIPTILGRVFDGKTFAPLSEVTAELHSNGKLVDMRNRNWQNPYTLVSNTPGTYTFLPASVPAEAVDQRRIFEYSLKIESPQHEPLVHFFKIPVISSITVPLAHIQEKTFKLPDLYLFPPGEAEQND
ncbi:MAG: late competence development ComFB family protein [Treponema sp.]|jgi:competence protein ComFB|nr:late competence development ComFB family protein [Treponema sp.]